MGDAAILEDVVVLPDLHHAGDRTDFEIRERLAYFVRLSVQTEAVGLQSAAIFGVRIL